MPELEIPSVTGHCCRYRFDADSRDLQEYERAMDEAIPQIIEAVRRRQELAEESRTRYLGE